LKAGGEWLQGVVQAQQHWSTIAFRLADAPQIFRGWNQLRLLSERVEHAWRGDF